MVPEKSLQKVVSSQKCGDHKDFKVYHLQEKKTKYIYIYI